MAITVDVQPASREGRAGAWFAATAGSSTEADLEATYDALEQALGERGMGLADVLRTRLFAATREGRDAASKVRFRRLAGPARCATSSYIDPTMFPAGDGVRVEGIALQGAGQDKIAVEYEPRQPPCRYVATGDLVFLSGVTAIHPTFEAQLDDLRPRITETLAMASQRLGRPVRPVSVTTYIHRDLDPGPGAAMLDRLGLPGVPLTVGRCDGYSAPGKLIEVEVDALAAAGG
jgi:hypothetical protein